MFARATIVLSLLASVEAFSSSSPLGRKLLSKARQLNNNQEVDMSWIPNYSIRFEKCHSLVQVAGEGNGNGNNQQGGIIYTQQLAEFSLCPSDSCTTGTSSCKNGAKYIVNLREFAQLYLQYKQDELDYACETIRQNCNNDDQDACYSAAGMDQCIEVEGQEQDDMDRYMQCDVLEVQNNNNNNNYWNYNNYQNNADYYREYFVGPYCSNNGKSVLLGVFLDEGCSIKASSGIYESLNYGQTLPYSSESLISHDCISCQEVDQNADNNNGNNNNNNNNQNDDPNVIELCENMYQMAGKCETNLQINYKDTTACDFISTVLPRMEGVSKSLGVSSGGSNKVAVAFAWTFGVLAFVLGIYAFLLYRRLRRSKVALNAEPEGNPTMA